MQQQQLVLFPEIAANDAPTIAEVLSRVQPAVPANDVRIAGGVDADAVRGQVILAIQERRVCRLSYAADGNIETSRDFEPYAITRVEDHWSVFGYCRLRGDLRTFRSDRIVRLEALETQYVPRPGLALERFILRRRGTAA